MSLTPATANLVKMVAWPPLWGLSVSAIANRIHLVQRVSVESSWETKQEGLMEVGVAGPPGAPVFKGRKLDSESAITLLPVGVGNPVLEKPQKAGNVKMRSWNICDYLNHIAFLCLWFQQNSVHHLLP